MSGNNGSSNGRLPIEAGKPGNTGPNSPNRLPTTDRTGELVWIVNRKKKLFDVITVDSSGGCNIPNGWERTNHTIAETRGYTRA